MTVVPVPSPSGEVIKKGDYMVGAWMLDPLDVAVSRRDFPEGMSPCLHEKRNLVLCGVAVFRRGHLESGITAITGARFKMSELCSFPMRS